MQPKTKSVTLANELPLQFGLSLPEEKVANIRETALNGIRIFPKPDKFTATAYFYASAFIAYEHDPSNRNPLTMIQFIELNDQMVIKANIRKGSTYIKNQLKAYERENPYDFSLNGKIQIATQFYFEYIFIFLFQHRERKRVDRAAPK